MSRPFVELYIADKKVEFKEPPQINITYSHSDLHNPTVVKNSFSKTVTIDGTPHNNQIFGCFYDMRRVSAYSENSQVGGYFNPNKKVPFTLYRNGEPMETGYVKLDKVKRNGNNIQYDITLYGGLGQFLYNLQYKEDGEEMKLSDLDYGGGDNELDLTIDRYVVRDAWWHITGMKEVGKIYDFINFAPCYNGIPNNFTADKVAIDTNASIGGNWITSKDGYTTVDGWILGELEKEYDEWQTNDLRSYLQRPVIRFKEIIKACCNPENNGGYLVDLDPDFFVDENPYYSNAWMTLPLVSELEIDKVEEDSEIQLSVSGDTMTVSGGKDGQTITFTFSIGFGANVNNAQATYLSTNRYLSSWDGSSESSPTDESTNVARYVQVIAYDSNDKIIGGSSIYSLYTYGGLSDDFYYVPDYETTISSVRGQYVRQSDGSYLFADKHFDFVIKNIPYEDGIYFKIVEKFSYSQAGYVKPNKNELYYTEYFDDDEGGSTVTHTYNVSSFYNEVSRDIEVGNITKEEKYITKKRLLNSEHTPCDYFLSYLKMFNLHIWKDMYEDIIYVRKRKNYFIDEKYDIEPYVDRGDDISITPITFDSKWMTFENESNDDGKLYKDYLDEFGIPYGIQKIDTNYNFDNSSTNLFDKSVFKSCITARQKSRYYLNLRYSDTDDDYDVPPYYLDGMQTFLFNGDGDTTEGTKITPRTSKLVRDWWDVKYFDLFPKPSFIDEKNEPIDGANVLLFYNGRQLMKDKDGVAMNFRITDDIPQFETLNEGEPCWILTDDWEIAVEMTIGGAPFYGDGYMPIFSRYITNENGWITHSWDFGTPKYLYIPDYTIGNTSDIYTQYWQPYIRDMYNVDTRVVECNVLLKERVIGDWLRRFYYWDGSYWILNKISDYDVTSNGTTKCEFVRVNDIQNYLQ